MINILFFVYFTGILVRLWICSTNLVNIIKDRIELSTSLTSWKRVTEGLALYKSDIDPYAGDIFHEMPLMLRVLNVLDQIFGSKIYVLFIAIDVLIAVILERIAKHAIRHYLADQKRRSRSFHEDSVNILLKVVEQKYVCLQVVAIYLLNPYTIATCAAKSTAIFNNLAIACTILYMLKGDRAKCCTSLAIASYISFYPWVLCIPVSIFLAKKEKPEGNWTDRIMFGMLVQSMICFGAGLGFLLYTSFILQGDWSYIQSTFGFIILAPDLSPNMGIFWYFFTETFEHFRLFFLYVFQINAFLYVAPLSIKLREHPLFLMYTCLTLVSIFKSYPTYADTCIYFALIPVFSFNFKFMNNGLVVTTLFLVCSMLSPIQWYLWMYAGSANSNFFYAITLLYTATQIIFITDMVQAFQKRQFHLIHGTKIAETETVTLR